MPVLGPVTCVISTGVPLAAIFSSACATRAGGKSASVGVEIASTGALILELSADAS